MTFTVRIIIVDNKSGIESEEVHALPLEFGVKPQCANAVEFDAKYQTISRRHATLEMDNGRLVLRDHSSNGSTVDGRTIRSARARVEDGTVIGIENYEIRVGFSLPIVVVHTSSDLRAKGRISIPPDGVAVLLQTGSELKLGSVAANAQEDDGSGLPVLELVAQSDGLLCRLPDDANSQVPLVNKKQAAGAQFKVPVASVIEIENDRFEVLRPGSPQAVCGEPNCHLLNPPVFEQNCRWCGFHLTAAGAFTRVIEADDEVGS